MDLEEFLANAEMAIQQNMADGETVRIAGTTVTKAELLAMIAARKKFYEEVREARNELDAKLKARRASEDETADFCTAFEAGVTSNWGTDANVKVKYGVPARKEPRKLTTEELVERARKAAATRKANKTMGRRQKERLKAAGNPKPQVTSSNPPASTENAGGAPAPQLDASRPDSRNEPAPPDQYLAVTSARAPSKAG